MDLSATGIDFAIVTALNSEREAVVSRLDSHRVISAPDEPYTYYRGEIQVGEGATYEVVVMQMIEMGNVEAASSTTHMIERWQPAYVLMVGIAGGVAKNDVAVGDVVVAQYVHYYEPGKRTDAGEQRRPQVFNVNRLLYAKARHYETSEWKDNIRVVPPVGASGFIPKAHFNPIASGEQVIAGSTTVSSLLQEVPKLAAIAMEGAGVARAADNASREFLEIRGISDLADCHKSDDWQEFAANAAAAFAIGFLKSKPVTPGAEGPHLKVRSEAPPLVVIRAQSQRKIGEKELDEALNTDLNGRTRQTALLDFSRETSFAGQLLDPQKAVSTLLDPEGEVVRLLSMRNEAEFIFHGHLHIPLAVLIGFLFTDRLRMRLYDFHPASMPPSWKWPACPDAEFPKLKIYGMPTADLALPGDVVLRMGVSYPVSAHSVEKIVPTPVADIDLRLAHPERGIVQSERQVMSYGKSFREVLDKLTVRMRHPQQRIHLFYAGPVSLAFHLGQLISASIHPPVVVWNYSRAYDWAVDLGAAARGEVRIESLAKGTKE